MLEIVVAMAKIDTMPTKSVFTIAHDKEAFARESYRSTGILLDEKLANVLEDQKNVINNFFENKKWDKHKKQSNPYELVFTSGSPSIAKLNPLSRSYFKHWEILKDFKKELCPIFSKASLTCAFLAEGPGGFIEAFTAFRDPQSKDTLFGITLISSDKSVPSWRLTKDVQQKHNISLLYGPEGNGSLYSMKNIIAFVQRIQENSCDYITADGGFDFSGDFNNQEENSIRLIISEIYMAIRCQKIGGAFLLKIFDINLPITRTLLYILYELYESITFVKPLTSRPANSEKYILCQNYKGTKTTSSVIDVLAQCIRTGKYNFIIESVFPSHEFLESVYYFNVTYVINQIIHINTTLCFIANDHDEARTLRSQIEHALKWCHKYEIPISIPNFIKATQSLIKDNKTC